MFLRPQALIQIAAILFLLFLGACTAANKEASGPPAFEADYATTLHQLLPEGHFEVEVMDSLSVAPRIDSLMRSFQANLAKNPQWAVDYVTSAEKGKLPYDPQFGITEAEYQEVQAYFDSKPKLIATSRENLEIFKFGSTIRFKGSGKLGLFNALELKVADQLAVWDKTSMLLRDTLNITKGDNAYGSTWKAYKWRYSLPENLEEVNLNALESLSLQLYELKLVYLEATEKTVLHFRIRIIDDGVKYADGELVIQFHPEQDRQLEG